VRQDGNAVRQGQSFGLVVRDIDGGLAEPALQTAQLLAHLDPQLEVEVGQRLVEHQDARLEHQRAGDRYALLLTPRQLRRESRRHPGEIDKLQHAADPVGDLRFAEPAQAQPECDIVKHRQMRKQRIILKNEADVAAVRRFVVKPLAMQANRALGERLEPGDAPQGRCLAAAARCEQREKFAPLHLERYRSDADLRRIPLGQLAYLSSMFGGI
jgi:hypothetical protein